MIICVYMYRGHLINMVNFPSGDGYRKNFFQFFSWKSILIVSMNSLLTTVHGTISLSESQYQHHMDFLSQTRGDRHMLSSFVNIFRSTSNILI